MKKKRIIVIALLLTIICSMISYADENSEEVEEVYPIILEEPISEENSR